MSRHVTSCHVMYCHVTSRHGTSCHVMSRHVTSCHIISRHVTSFHVMPHHFTSCHVMSRQATSNDVMSRHFTSFHDIPRHAASCHVTSCHVMSRPVTSWHILTRPVTSCHVTSCHVGCPEGCRYHTASAVYNLVFAVFHLWRLAITTLDKQSCFYYNICGFSADRWFGYNIPIKLIILSLKNTLEIKTLSCLTSIFWGFEFDLRPSEVNSGIKYFCGLKAYIIISNLTTIDTFYFELFLIRSTSKSSIDTFPLSRTVFEIFDFKVFRVWPWPLTFRGFLRSKLFSSFESPYRISYLKLLLTLPLYLVSFLRYMTSQFLGFDLWPLKVIWAQFFYTIRKPIYDFLLDFYGHHLSISYRFRDIWLQRF